MSDNVGASCNRDTRLENLAAELTLAAYGVALRHGTAGTWVDLELDLWKALADTVKARGREWVRPAGQPETAHRDGHDGLGHGRDARRFLSGE
jgi:hypothetical protein